MYLRNLIELKPLALSKSCSGEVFVRKLNIRLR